MFFELYHASTCFQDYINKILAKKVDFFVIVFLYDILIYMEDESQINMKTVCWVLGQLDKIRLFANLKKSHFYKDEICFLCYVVSAKRVCIKWKNIDVRKNWPELISMRNILVFLGFDNFYWRFISGFNEISGLLTSMLRIISTPQSVKNLLLNIAEDQ